MRIFRPRVALFGRRAPQLLHVTKTHSLAASRGGGSRLAAPLQNAGRSPPSGLSGIRNHTHSSNYKLTRVRDTQSTQHTHAHNARTYQKGESFLVFGGGVVVRAPTIRARFFARARALSSPLLPAATCRLEPQDLALPAPAALAPFERLVARACAGFCEGFRFCDRGLGGGGGGAKGPLDSRSPAIPPPRAPPPQTRRLATKSCIMHSKLGARA